MKTQRKQLPNEFTFICDEHSKEQLEKLGVDLGTYELSHKGSYYVIENNKIMWNCFNYKGDTPLINLSDYIEQEQPIINTIGNGSFKVTSSPSILLEIKTDGNRIHIEPKWQEKTRGGHVDIKEIKQIGDRLAIFGLRNDVDLPNDNSRYWFCDLSGINIGGNRDFDLIPYNPLLTTLEKELEEVRSKEKEILEKIEELKTK